MLIVAALCAPKCTRASEIQGNKPFLASSINNSHPFVGQEVLLTYTLFFRNTAPKISDEVAPSLQGLWSRETGSERFIKSMPAMVQGEHFRSAMVKQFRLVPIQSGRITLKGYSMLCTLPQDNVSKELPDTRLRITATTITINAQNLPAANPEKLSGAVGIFSLGLITDKQKLKIGEPVSLKLILSGTGSLLTLEMPNLTLPESFRHNPPEKTTTLIPASETTSGTITATIIAWPQSEGVFQIPSTALVVFNPQTEQFSTLHTQPLAIRVTPAEREAKEDGEHSFDTATETKKRRTPIFTIITLLLVMSSAAIYLVRKKRVDDAKKLADEERTDQQSGNSKSAKNMKQQIFILLEESGIKSPGGMTRAELNEALQKINIPDESRSELPAVLDSLDRILYSQAAEQENRIPDWIAAKIDILLRALKKAGSSR